MVLGMLALALGFGKLMAKFGPSRFGGNNFCQRMRRALAALVRGHERTYRDAANVHFSGDGVQVDLEAQTVTNTLVNLNWQEAATALFEQPSAMRDAEQSQRM